tara:strand:- start:286 stop:594 length:309 start_codon:yes stop_codon:yes gene_type:complete
MIIYVDVDETICETPQDRDYSKSKPIEKNIKKINELYYNGNTIVYWTARGTVSGLDWTDTTIKQLEDWGAKHHKVILGKPHFDLYICDKSINSSQFFEDKEK